MDTLKPMFIILPMRPMSKKRSTALREALAAVGGVNALAEKMTKAGSPITPQAVSQWKFVPVKRVSAVEKISGVPRQRLRPDIFDE